MSDIKNYYEALGGWMNHFGLASVNVEPNWLFDKAFSVDFADVSKFGYDYIYVFVLYKETPPNPAEFIQFSSECFNYASKIHKGGPPGVGAHLTIFPLLIVDNITNELADTVRTYTTKHFASVEFPGILDLSSKNLYYYPDTPVWGALYYAGYRQKFYSYFSPNAWKEIANKNTGK
jgi:hypothetical protein